MTGKVFFIALLFSSANLVLGLADNSVTGKAGFALNAGANSINDCRLRVSGIYEKQFDKDIDFHDIDFYIHIMEKTYFDSVAEEKKTKKRRIGRRRRRGFS